VVLFLAGARHYDAFQFLGLPQSSDKKPHGVLTGSSRLNTRGILGRIRHPWYAGALVIIWARPLDISAIIVNLILTAYIFIGTFLEEKKLLREFGDEYRAYQAEVSSFFPFKWLRSKTMR
jgi:protein-S-isoprenylcysteine O-methyltransferase Ste14